MTRFKPRQEHVGRTNYQLRMPYPGNTTPEGVMANFRELERWGNALPVPRPDTMMPVLLVYESEPMIGEDVLFPSASIDIKDLIAEYSDGVFPSGTYLVYLTVNHSNAFVTDHSAEAVGWNIYASANAQYPGQVETSTNGVYSGSAMEVVTDIDFTAETFETEWRLPIVGPVGSASAIGLLQIDELSSNVITFDVGASCAYIADPATSGELAYEPTGFVVFAWIWRVNDGYEIPRTQENITPP